MRVVARPASALARRSIGRLMSTAAAVAFRTLATPRHVAAAAGRLCWYGGQVAVKLTSAETAGGVGMWVWDAHRGAGSPVHVHSLEDEYFLVVDGHARLFVGDGHERRVDPERCAVKVGPVSAGAPSATWAAPTQGCHGDTHGPPPGGQALARRCSSDAVAAR